MWIMPMSLRSSLVRNEQNRIIVSLILWCNFAELKTLVYVQCNMEPVRKTLFEYVEFGDSDATTTNWKLVGKGRHYEV